MPEKRKVELKPVDALSPAAVELRAENLLAMGSVTFHLSDNYLSLHRHIRYYIRINGCLLYTSDAADDIALV